MRKYVRLFPVLVAMLAALSVGVVAWADDDDDDDDRRPATIPFDEINFFFELNETDEDLGVQLCLGATPWKRLKIIDPDGKTILDVKGRGSLGDFGLSSLFFESNEPNFDDVPKEDILDLFPEGKYKFVGRTIEGDKLVGSKMLTHDIPDGPEILTPEEDEVVDPDEVEVTWEAVTTPAGIEIESYQIIVTNDEDPQFKYDVRLPADATALTVPAEFFESDTEYELEILAVEKSGNQTISLIFFKTE
jgi:hypothetical protein